MKWKKRNDMKKNEKKRNKWKKKGYKRTCIISESQNTQKKAIPNESHYKKRES